MPAGGKRPGAGRKPSKHGTKQSLTVRLTPDVIRFLAEAHGENQSQAIDQAIRNTAAFKRWLVSQETSSSNNILCPGTSRE